MISLQIQYGIIDKIYNDIVTNICEKCIMISLHKLDIDIITY